MLASDSTRHPARPLWRSALGSRQRRRPSLRPDQPRFGRVDRRNYSSRWCCHRIHALCAACRISTHREPQTGMAVCPALSRCLYPEPGRNCRCTPRCLSGSSACPRTPLDLADDPLQLRAIYRRWHAASHCTHSSPSSGPILFPDPVFHPVTFSGLLQPRVYRTRPPTTEEFCPS